jgi:hypothetical protein
MVDLGEVDHDVPLVPGRRSRSALRTSQVLRASKSPLSTSVGPSVTISMLLTRSPEPESSGRSVAGGSPVAPPMHGSSRSPYTPYDALTHRIRCSWRR